MAENRYYANRVRSIEDRALTPFFVAGGEPPQHLCDYFASFDLILSYLFDPDWVFRGNLECCAIKKFLAGPSKLTSEAHAAVQLARPLEQIDLLLTDPAARLHLSEIDRKFARDFFSPSARRWIAIHPGSGSQSKNWPLENWKKLGDVLLSRDCEIVLVGGEADEEQIQFLVNAWKNKPVQVAKHLDLPYLAALLERCLFIGNDSGISHLAAATGARSILIFGPTNPAVWAPMNENVTVLQAPERNLERVTVNEVIQAIEGDHRDRQFANL